MDGTLEQVLTYVNQARKAMGQPPLPALPQGVPGHAEWCPLAFALGGIVGTEMWIAPKEDDLIAVQKVWETDREEDSLELPPPLAKFVEDFDHEVYPELIKEDV